jgi:hypothetical protein
MEQAKQQNLIKLYIDEKDNGKKNKLLVFKVKDMTEAGRVYMKLKPKVKTIRAAYFQNYLVGNRSFLITPDKAESLAVMWEELREVNKPPSS